MLSKAQPIIDFVRANQPVTANEVAAGTGIHLLTIHRYLSGGRGKLSNDLFTRVKVNTKRIDPGNRVRGCYHYLYSLNEQKKPVFEPKKQIKKIVINRDPITSALFGTMA
jgi:protein tyrosine/serine phosphatase